MSFLNSGEIITLDELTERLSTTPFVENRSYRVTGIVVNVNLMKKYCQIQHGNSTLLVEFELLAMSEIVVDGLIQFIGELKAFRSEPKDFDGIRCDYYIHARVSRPVNDLNLDLFFKAVAARKRFLENESWLQMQFLL